MAGHSKWSNIKARKGAQDKKRAKIFARVIKEITIAIKENGNNGDPETNPALRNAIQNARGANLPKDNIERAIKRASGADSENYKHLNFEGYGPHGIAMFVECTTDNSNRTVANIRAIFNKYGGSLGTNGSLEFLFDRTGVFTIQKEELKIDWEELQLILIEHGAESFEEEEEVYLIYSDYKSFGNVSDKLLELNIETQNAAVEPIPNHTEVLPLEQAMTIINMIEAFEDDDDVQNVYHNLELTDELSEELSKM
ncbi:MAG: YebC/PmpR family DNA-binding transcriptional regulator [Dysgonamonadaceae bacterium]|jgi:YebC/PmpR family DNA-binding regulatory protein|nr:YebC/PmpR family DNA-binding transcriptional regulator [Dysgonamonadaceae bacterium]MDD3728389.1 YebC/PmpR family DNA-binding transcriptional regulator [Dysgonamonadaceae bacterium]MDD4606447.1 YebC/PmpR family DNA-binding transcriptional regulator [Dysgonamonadaceae bacterium]